MLHQIVAAKPLLQTGQGIGLMTLLQLATATTGLGQCMVTGQVARAGDWVQASLADELAFGAQGAEMALEPERVRLLVEAPPVVQNLVPSLVCEWTILTFDYFRKMNAMRNVGEIIADPCIAATTLARGGDRADLGAEALLSIGLWAAKVDGALAKTIAKTLERWRNEGVSRATIARGFMTTLAKYSSLGSEAAWADVVEREHSETLDEMGRLHVQVAASSDAAEYERRKEAILDAIADVQVVLKDARPYQRGLWLSSAFGQIAPLVLRLAQSAHGDALLELLSAWYGVPPAERLKRVLIMAPYTERGALVLWGTEAIIGGNNDPSRFHEAVSAMNHALNLTFSVEGAEAEPEPPAIPERMGTAVEGASDQLLSAVDVAYDLKGLRSAALPADASFIALNPVPLNVQSAALRICGYTWPNAISLRKPLSDSQVRRVGIWHRPLRQSGDEVAGVRKLFHDAGIEVVYEESGGGNQYPRFTALYQRPDLDVLWVIGHGAYVPYSTHLSSLDIFEPGSITVEELARLSIPVRQTRRLLVLNVCNAGNVAGVDGIGQAGIAGLVTTPMQATIAHLWTADPVGAAALGVLLASGLSSGRPYFESFTDAMRILSGTNPAIAARLESVGASLDLVQAVITANPALADFIRSGSAVLYE